jgi:CheY-like chemotaxis protein
MAVSVLVVDDDDGFRSLAVGMLRAAGHDRVYEAATVAEALSEAARSAPEAALVDIGLPDGDGLALARQLAAPPRATRVVLISADGDATDDAAAQSVGAVAFVAKEDLEEACLRELLGGP